MLEVRCSPATFRRRGGFTLIEFVAVLSILAILAAAIVPAVIKRLDLAAYSAEQTSLTSITNALLQQLVINQSLPSSSIANQWATNAAQMLNVPVSEVLTNARRNARVYLVDTNGWLGSSYALNGFTQTSAGCGTNSSGFALIPTNARVMIVSSIGKPLTLASGAMTPNNFNNIWNNSYPQVPAGWTFWTGNGADLVIQRMTYTGCFERLILINHYTNNAAFTIGASSVVNLTGMSSSGSPSFYSTNGWDSYYLTGTSLGLWCSNGAALQMKLLLTSDSSYVYESPGLWQGTIQNGPFTTNSTVTPAILANNFSIAATNFFYSPTNHWIPFAGGGFQGSPQDILSAMDSFMSFYTMWANTTPPFSSLYSHSMGDLNMGTVINNGILQDGGGNSAPGILSNGGSGTGGK